MLPITLIAACRQHRHGALEIGWLRRMAGPMACGAACGALIAAALNGPVLAAMFALQSSWYGTRLLLRRGDIAPVACRGGLLQHFARWPTWIAAPPMAAFCACVGMGGGSIVTPFLLRQGMPFRHAVATAAALNVCISLGGSAAFAVSGAGGVTACVPAAAVLSVGAMASVSFGVSLAHRVPAVLLQRLVGLVNLASAATLFWQIGVH